ncbi:MAG: enoyl-CoA hydratase/isomerase family protein, partial [Alphaproteobacteria bacterium]
MEYETIKVDQDGSAFVITLNRPDRRNAFSVKMMEEIASACREAEDAASVRAVIVTGGTAYFSAGADLNEAMAVTSTKAGV